MEQKKKELLSIFNAGIKAVDPFNAVNSILKRDEDDILLSTPKKEWRKSLKKFKRIFVTGCGKAGAPMVQALEEILKNYITGGIVTVKYGYTGQKKPDRVSIVEAGHPFPDSAGVVSCGRALDLLKNATKDDLVIGAVSGGGSALWPQPVLSVSFEEKLITNKILLRCGANIHEMNCIRKHLSLVKGGQAAKAASPAEIIVLIISDVVGDNLDVIASGPFTPDPTTFMDGWGIIEKYDLSCTLPASVVEHFQNGVKGLIADTPKSDEFIFEKVTQVLCATNAHAIKAASQKAEELGYKIFTMPDPICGEAKEAARKLVAKSEKLKEQSTEPIAVIAGGETTVTLPSDHGTGGRNQELILAAAIELDGIKGITAGSCGTDGNDGPTDAAGAFADGDTASKAEKIGMNCKDYLNYHDAYHFFYNLNDLIITGPTNTNVMDIQCVLIN